MTNDTDGSVVWILGAGFSKSLGAPLLADLFTERSVRELRARFPAEVDTWQLLSLICEAGAYDPPSQWPMSREWRHAEEFIERVERAARKFENHGQPLDDFARKAIERYSTERGGVAFDAANNLFSSVESTRRTSETLRKFLAAEVDGFLNGADPDDEKWAPYRHWIGNTVCATDTIVTFNYDRAIETALDAEAGNRRAQVLIPDSEREQGIAPILKLHGSTNWTLETKPRPRLFETDGAAPVPFIAVPGPHKREACSRLKAPDPNKPHAGLLVPLWKAARKAVETAHVIVIIGYSFPPSDAMTRDKVMSWVRTNAETRMSERGSNALLVHTVLGENTNHETSARLKGVFEALEPVGPGGPRIKLKQWPLRAEDFLALGARKRLLHG